MVQENDDDHGQEWDQTDCEKCGSFQNWEDCYECGGEGYFDEDDLMSEDPLWYQPGDSETCDICKGKGGWWVCSNKNCGDEEE